jgi:opacity protein-like surface antigen
MGVGTACPPPSLLARGVIMNVRRNAVIAFAAVCPAIAQAQSTEELKAELGALKAHVQKLEAMIEKAEQPKPAPLPVPMPMPRSDEAAELGRLRIKADAMDDALESGGLKGLKISGYIDPSYVRNRNAATSSFVFLNNNSSINGSGESFGYDNTTFGSAMLNLDKELDGGTRLRISLMPSKSIASGYNFGNLVHEASASIPLGDQSTRLLLGQIPDWSGYELIPSTQNKLLTHNLLFDFSAANFYTGAGLQLLRGKWDSKIMIGNMNKARVDDGGERTPGVFYRVDYARGEFSGFGLSGTHAGFDADSTLGRVDLMEVDAFYTRGAWNLQGQLSYGGQQATAANRYGEARQRWYGLSSLLSYKVTARLEAIARLDYIFNGSGGGGVLGATLAPGCKDLAGFAANCPDGRNGFGSGMVWRGGQWVVYDPTRGANRGTLAFGTQYLLVPGVSVKGEYRYDYATARTFRTLDGQYRRDNQVIGVSTVVSF